MNYNDHLPPHIHAEYQGYKGRYTIEAESKPLRGSKLPKTADKIVRDWVELRELDLAKNWELARKHKELMRVIPAK